MSQDVKTPQEVDLYSPLDPDALPDDPVVLKQMLVQLVSMLRSETKRREQVERNLDQLIRKLTAPKSTAPAPGQKVLFDVEELFDASVPPAALPTSSPEKRQRKHTPHGRRKPPANLEQVDVVHDLPEELKQQLGAENLIPLPDVITFQYDYQAAKLRVLRHLQRKYVRRDGLALGAETDTPTNSETDATSSWGEAAPLSEPGTTIATSATAGDTNSRDVVAAADAVEPTPATPPAGTDSASPRIVIAPKRLALPGCAAAPGLLAFIWLSKYGDHLPLYRLETITQRYGISFPRSTTCDWMMELGEVLQPLWQLMVEDILLSRVIHTDDTTVPMQDPDSGARSTARFWNYLGDEEHPLTVFEFTRTHERVGPATFLANYRGYLQADAYNGYDGLYLESGGRITEVGCWQHARKRYKEAVQTDMRATCGMAFIKSLYAVEDKIRKLRHSEWRDLTLDDQAARIVEIRQRDSVPLLRSLREWIDKTIGEVLPKTKLADAFRYTLNQWPALNEFPQCGLLEIDNNAAERSHRHIAIGRNNWMYVGSERGGRAAATHFSFIASCKMNGVEPFEYLVDVLNRLPVTPAGELRQLLPHLWAKHRRKA
jgi:transposase